MLSLGAPDEILASDHAVPPPEYYDEPVTRSRETFDAIRRAAAELGLELGRPAFEHPNAFKVTFAGFAWGDEVSRLIEKNLASIPPDPHGLGEGAWPLGFAVWRDSERATFIVVFSDWDSITARDILAWGPEAERYLATIEKALDDDRLWE